MPAITFPASPVNGQVFTSGTSAWQWDGTAWRVIREYLGSQNQLDLSQIKTGTASVADSTFYGGSFNVVKGFKIFTSSGIFTPVTGATFYVVDVVSAGAGGGANTNSNGAYGGGGGGRIMMMIPAAWLTALSGSVVVTVGAGGIGVINSDGTSGGSSSFGPFVTVYGGSIPINGSPWGGGLNNPTYTALTSTTQAYGSVGAPVASAGEWGGGGGGSGASGTLINGGSSIYGAGGGGGMASAAGGAGGATGLYVYNASFGAVGNGGLGKTSSGNLTGNSGTNGSGVFLGGGGGAVYSSTSNSTNTGGAGGYPGGGGGAASSAGGTPINLGGAGANGRVIVYWG